MARRRRSNRKVRRKLRSLGLPPVAQQERTARGYRRFRCRDCGKQCN